MSATELGNYLSGITNLATGSRQLVIFDLDRTLVAGYSALALAAERLRGGELSGLIGGGLELIRDLLRSPGGHRGNYRRYMQRLAQALAGCPESYLAGLGQSAWERTLSKALYPEALGIIWRSSLRLRVFRQSPSRGPLALMSCTARDWPQGMAA